MHPFLDVVASFFDPADNGVDVSDAGTILIFFLGVAGVLWALAKFFLLPAIHKIVIEEIRVATAPIQRGANGGYSLPDVARKSDWNGEALKAIADHLRVDLPSDMTMKRNVPHDKQDD